MVRSAISIPGTLMLGCVLATGSVRATEPEAVISPQSLDDYALALASPVNTLWSLGNSIDYLTFQGDLADADDQSGLVYRLQPSFSLPLDSGRVLLFRLTVPVNFEQPTYRADREYPPFLVRQLADTLPTDGQFDADHNSVANTVFDLAWGGVRPDGVIYMLGVAGEAPTSRDKSSRRDQYLLGPEAAIGRLTTWGMYGAWLTHLTRVSGDDAYDTNLTSLELFFEWSLGSGWHAFSRPVITYDWEAAGGNDLFVPISAGISRLFGAGTVPIRLELEVQNFVESPAAYGPEWLMTFSVTPVFDNPLAR